MKVNEVMTRSAECTRPDATLHEAAERMKALNVGSLPVCDNDRLVGMVTDRDITVRATAEGLPPTLGRVRDVMTPDVIYCFEDQDIGEARTARPSRRCVQKASSVNWRSLASSGFPCAG